MDMLSGSIWDKIILFALPLAATSILQQLFNSADVAVVGHYYGNLAIAAVGVNTPIINILINLFVGLSIGANVILSTYLGAGRKEEASKTTHTAILISFIVGIFVGILGILLARPFLVLLKTQKDIIDMASLYLKIYFAGMPFIMLYNFENAIFRSKGDTKTPLIVLIIAGLLNVGLNFFFVAVCDMSVEGVAIATVISNIISAIILYIILAKTEDETKLEFKKLKINFSILKQTIKVGIPAGVQSTIFSISNLFIMSALNILGSLTVAGNTAAMYYDLYIFFIVDAFSQAATSFVGQNYGAGNFKRCQKVTKIAMGLGAAVAIVVAVILIIFPKFFLGLYTDDLEVINIGVTRLIIIGSTVFLNVINTTLSGTLRVYGYTVLPVILTIFGVCGVRILWIYTAFAAFNTYSMLCWAYPISWLVCDIAIIIVYLIDIKKVKARFM